MAADVKRVAVQTKSCYRHTTMPPEVATGGWKAWYAWALVMSRTHRQTQCKDCRQWTVWVPLHEQRCESISTLVPEFCNCRASRGKGKK